MKTNWTIGVVWADGVACGSEQLHFSGEGSAREVFGVLKMAMESDAGSRLSETPIIVTVKDEFGSELKLYGRLIRVLRITDRTISDPAAKEYDAEAYRNRGYAEERGRHEYQRDLDAGKFEDKDQ